MLEGLDRLVALQRHDERLAALEDESAAIPGHRTRIGERRVACDERLAGAEEALRNAEHEQRAAEVALQDREALLKRLEGQQSQVKTNEAYTALLHEMEQARQAISDGETRILEAMETLEEGRAAKAEAETGVAAEREDLAAQEQQLAAREVQLVAEIEQLRSEREGVGASLESGMLDRYRKIAARRRPAVVLVDGEICGGCRVDIPPQSYNEILASNRLVTCGNCQRILLPARKIEALASS